MYVVVKQDAKNGFIISIAGPFPDIDDAYAYVGHFGVSDDEHEITVRFVDRP